MKRALSLLAAVAAGITMAVQARVTGALAVQTHSPLLAALVCFGAGLVFMAAVVAARRSTRQAAARVDGAVRGGGLRWWYLPTGLLGAYAVFGQAITVDVVGVVIYSLVFIMGQMVSSAWLDARGATAAGRQPLGPARLAGVLLALAGVLVAVVPRLDGAAALALLVLPLLVVLSGGLLQSVQMAFNGITARHLGRPEPLALFNYAFGSAGLLLVCLPELAAGGLARLPLAPGDWWYYTGGVLGSVVVIAGAMLTRTIGSLLFALGLVAGQLLGSLGVDLLWPAAGARTGWATAAGCAVTVLALVLASVPGLRRRSRRSSGSADAEPATVSSH